MPTLKRLSFLTVLFFVAIHPFSTFAGSLGGKNTVQGNGRVEVYGLKDSDIPADRVQKSSAPLRVDHALSNPQPERITASQLSKYPGVSTAGLSGTYTIPGDFPSLAAAAAVVNFVGLSGNSIFELTTTSYTEVAGQVVFGGAYAGAGTYNLTIQPSAGTAVTMNFTTGNSQGKGISFNAAKNVTIDGVGSGGASLTLQITPGATFPLADPMGSTVYMTGTNEDIAIENVTIKGVVNDPVWEDQTEGRSCVFVFSAEGDAPSIGLTFDNVTFINGTIGLKMLPEVPQVTVENLTVDSCRFGGAFGGRLIIGSWLEYGARVTFTNNQLKDLYWLDWYWNNVGTEYAEDVAFNAGNIYYGLGMMTAWHHFAIDGGSYAYNVVDGMSGDVSPGTISYGTRTFGANNGYSIPHDVHIRHNRFQNIFLDHAGQQLIGIRSAAFSHIYHNTIRLTGTKTISTTWNSNCLNGATTAYNNVFSNEILGGAASTRRGVQAGGTIDYNAIYSSGVPAVGQTTVAGTVEAGINPNGLFGPVGTFDANLHITTGVSSARQVGKANVFAGLDIDGDPVDSTTAGSRDAGADQFSPLGSNMAPDVMVCSIYPSNSFITLYVPTVTVKNNAQGGATFNVSLTISPDGYSDVKSVSLLPGETKVVSFASWTPPVGMQTLSATTLLGGDGDATNDTMSRSLYFTYGDPISSPTVFSFNTGAQGWTGSGDWVRSSSFTKLEGPDAPGVCGTGGGIGAAWVTQRPDDPSTYTEGAYATSQGYATTYPGPNYLMSPWMNFSGVSWAGTDLYISFMHSIRTEPAHDFSWMQYTTDGSTWHDLGGLNDPNGINWYNEDLYENAARDTIPDYPDTTIYGLPFPEGRWTSNGPRYPGYPGDAIPTGPDGWVFCQLHVTEMSHPALVGGQNVRFRYVALSDPAGAPTPGGWAFDNFQLAATLPMFPGGNIEGHAWTDANGNGIDDGEPDIAGAKIYVSIFNTLIDSVTTNASGDYIWTGVTLPASYELRIDVPGVAFTVPYGTSGVAEVCHPATGSTVIQDFGTFIGGVSGVKFSDVNDNAANDSEPNLSGWTIEAHKDSANGQLVGSDTTTGSGYSILLPPGTFVVKEVEQSSVGRRTYPGGAGSHTVVVNNVTPLHTAKDFGNFIYGRLRVQLTVDQNGNGAVDPADITAVPSGASSAFLVTTNGGLDTVGSSFSLGNGSVSAQIIGLDTGTYTVHEVDSIGGWRRTKGGDFTFVVNTSGEADTARYLDFKHLVITGTKFNDLDGDGVKDGGEPGLAGWTVNVSGGSYYGGTSAVTDTAGAYSIDSVFTGAHTVTEVAQAGWTQTTAAIAPINGISGNLVNTANKNFGNFQNTTISGLVYRDYNGNGNQDAGDVTISGMSIDLASGANDVSDGVGYSFSGVLTTDTVRITAPLGFSVTEPAAGEHAVAILSGGSAMGLKFGLFQTTDSSVKYRTFPASQLGYPQGENKPGKAPKAGKPYDPVKNKPNTANLVDILINPKTGVAPGGIVVGLPGQFNAGGKEKVYVKPNKQSAFFQSLLYKFVPHSGMPRGFDVDIKGKPILKLQKMFGPDKKQNNRLFAELLSLKLNLLSSGVTTPAGLGALIYADANSSYDGWTIDEIADYADTVMTNFEFVPLGVYTALDTVARKINGAFASEASDDTANGWANPPLTWKAYTSVQSVSFLKPNPGHAPKNRRELAEPEAVPTAFALSQNYPNPFNPTTTIEFDLPEASFVTLKVYNLLGQEVATLLNREEVEFGDAVEFNASALPSGVYLYRIAAETIADEDAGIAPETFSKVMKMVLLR